MCMLMREILKLICKKAFDKLHRQQGEARVDEDEEPPHFVTGDSVWLKSYCRKKGRNPKLSPKYVGPYEIVEVLPHHTYRMVRDGRFTVQHEGRIRLRVERQGSVEPQPQPQHLPSPTTDLTGRILDRDRGDLSNLIAPSRHHHGRENGVDRRQHVSRGRETHRGADSPVMLSDRFRGGYPHDNCLNDIPADSSLGGGEADTSLPNLLWDAPQLSSDVQTEAEVRSGSGDPVLSSPLDLASSVAGAETTPSSNLEVMADNAIGVVPRRSGRVRAPPPKLSDYVVEIQSLVNFWEDKLSQGLGS